MAFYHFPYIKWTFFQMWAHILVPLKELSLIFFSLYILWIGVHILILQKGLPQKYSKGGLEALFTPKSLKWCLQASNIPTYPQKAFFPTPRSLWNL